MLPPLPPPDKYTAMLYGWGIAITLTFCLALYVLS